MNDLINIENKILVIRGQQVILDSDLAGLYEVETRRINEQVKRNIARFPEQFCFQLTKQETEELSKSKYNSLINLKSQIAISSWGGKRKPSYAFTEQGVAMLSAVLHSEKAIKVSIDIMNAFVAMRQLFINNAHLFQRLDRIETKQLETDQKFETIFTLMDKYKIKDKQGIFFQGQIFDAFSFFQNLIQKAQKEIILIDSYIDLTVLERLSKKNDGVNVIIYTKRDTPVTHLEISRFNVQYPALTVKYTKTMHDRFLILDNSEIYHIGASLKDLGKKCFAFTKLEDAKSVIQEILNRV